MKKVLFFSVLAITLFSCSEEEDSLETPKAAESKYDFEGIEILFDEDTFEYAKSAELLQEINICSTEQQEEMGLTVPDCSPEFFKLFPLKRGESVDQGFVLVTKANTGGIALRRIIVFQRERGALVKTNGFVGSLIGKRKTDNGYDDLLIRFKELVEGDEVFYNCIISWDGDRYQFKTAEFIEVPASQWSARIKDDVKDSVSREILKTITDNNMIF